MLKIIILAILLIFSFETLFAQNLFNQKVWQIEAVKKSNYIEQGIFHFTGKPEKAAKAMLMNMRYRYDAKEKYERIVIDFDAQFIPKVYGHIAKKEHKLFLDLFNTQLGKNELKFNQSALLKTANFYPITSDMLSMELIFKNEVAVEVFYLENPGRLVIDVKNL